MRTTPLTAAIFLAAAVALAGCASHEQRSLAGSAWQLVSIESMDDKQGTTPVPDPGKFTVEFADDGQAFFQIDCNRGKGTFTAQPSEDGTSGSLTFGPIATTRMMCPQPSLDQVVSKSLSNVRTYLFKGEHLHLSLMADGGILTWKQTEPKA